MLTLDEIKIRLADRRLDVVSDATGLHRSTIARVRDGDQANPTYQVMRKLSAYLEAQQ